MEPASQEQDDPSLAELGGLGVLLAAALSAAVVRRRRQQLSIRPAGRRVPQPSPQARRFEADLAHVAARAPEPPAEVGPASALVGGRGDEFVTIDVEQAHVVTVAGPEHLVDDLMAGLVTGLALQPWSCETALVVQGDLPVVRALDEPQVTLVGTVDESVDALQRLVTSRRGALGRLGAEGARPGLDELRSDDDTWEAWRPVVHVITSPATPELLARVTRLLDGPSVGVGVVLAHVEGPSHCLHVIDEHTARIDAGEAFSPHLIDATARRALLEIFDTAGSLATTPAPWWSADDDLPPTITALRRRPALDLDEEEPVEPSADQHPTLYLLGPLDLRGCHGEEPARARRQCIEYCAWIAMNPGRTATMMSRQLLVAESTRRSNLSRLRTWLGSDENGEAYLPDAYSGRIELHPGITSDWEQFELLTSGGVNRCSTDALVDAMRLVRGAPLADAAPGQWTWAEEVRVDMVCTIRDAAVVLANRAMEEHDLDLARWAAARGLTAAPNDELLLCARLRTEHLAGNRPEVERLVLQVTRAARNLGVDLRDETVATLQEVMEGRRRTA